MLRILNNNFPEISKTLVAPEYTHAPNKHPIYWYTIIYRYIIGYEHYSNNTTRANQYRVYKTDFNCNLCPGKTFYSSFCVASCTRTVQVAGKINAFFCSVKTCRSKCHVETHGHVAFSKIYEFFHIQGYVRRQVNQVRTVLFYSKTWRSSCVVYEIVLIIIVIIKMTYSNKERVCLHEKYGWPKCVLNK